MTRTDLPCLLKSLLRLRLGQELLELLLGELRLARLGRARTNGLRRSERLLLLLRLLEKLLLLLLLEELLLRLLWSKLLRLLGLLWCELSRLLLREKVGGERINLTVLVVVAGESFQSNLLPGELRHGDLGRLLGSLWSKLLGLLGKLLLWSKLLLGVLTELLLLLLLLELEGWVGLLWLGGELLRLLLLKLARLLLLELARLLLLELLRILLELLRILSELLVLLELSLELVWPLLLLEVPKVLVEVAGVELLRGGSTGVEVSRVEDRSPGSLSGVGEVLPLCGGVVLLSNLLLLLHHSLLESNHSLVSLLLQLEGGIGLLRGGLHLSESVDLLQLQVGLEAGAVVGAVLHYLDLTVLVQEPVLPFHIPFGILGLQSETAVAGLVTDSVGTVLIDLIDLLHNDDRVLSGGGGSGGGGGGGGDGGGGGRCLGGSFRCVSLSAALCGFLSNHKASKEN